MLFRVVRQKRQNRRISYGRVEHRNYNANVWTVRELITKYGNCLVCQSVTYRTGHRPRARAICNACQDAVNLRWSILNKEIISGPVFATILRHWTCLSKTGGLHRLFSNKSTPLKDLAGTCHDSITIYGYKKNIFSALAYFWIFPKMASMVKFKQLTFDRRVVCNNARNESRTTCEWSLNSVNTLVN